MAQANAVECGFCIRRGRNLVEPKSLSCGHVHCEECLTANFQTIGIVQCPTCSEVFDVNLDTLPNATIEGDNSPSCDICERKGIHNQPAIKYCTDCVKKYCTKHLEHHDELNEDHHKIEMSGYKRKARKLQTVYCSEHKEEEYKAGCPVCLAVFCAHCMIGKNTCADGKPHDLDKLVTLDQLVMELTKNINKLKTEVIGKEEKSSDLFKRISKTITDYESSTKEMIKALHQARDRQIEAIRLKYDNLETELVTLRAMSQSEMTRYMEEDVGIKLSELSNHRLRIEAKLRECHQVDIVKGYRKVRDEIQALICDEMSSFQLQNSMSLVNQDESRDIEVKLVPSTDVSMDWGRVPAVPEPALKSLTLLQTVQVSADCTSVCHYKGNTYAGLGSGGIDRIDENYQLTKSFISLPGYVIGFTVYKDRVYSLVKASPNFVYVHNVTGQLITRWRHPDTSNNWVNKLVIISDQLFIPDQTNKRLTVYSLTGETLRHIPCSLLGADHLALCAVGSDSVVVFDCTSSKGFRVNITTGKVIWTSNEVAKPQGMTSCGQSYVCVASYSCKKIHVLSTVTGKVLSELTAIEVTKNVLDLEISGRTLIVPCYDNKKVLFYQLNMV